ncbi:MAG: hemerythrin domain-containing protein [Kineosporiaceae bacterium]|nr:hemerythrin domain-containing protein [Kineosporiaceae bacterium]MBK8076857.1 hemerythrin domain-containing protein [Kineosporiaceae bacterium]
MSSDAIVILREDHKRIKALFRRFAETGPRAETRRGELTAQILRELTVHTHLENEVMYPEVRRLVPDLEADILESYEEHHVADLLAAELANLPVSDERFVAKMTVLAENVTHHIAEEEDDWFPVVREALSRTQLQEIGQRMEQLRSSAPTQPSQPSALRRAVDAVIP